MPDYFGTYQNMNVVEYLDFFARSYGLRSYQRRSAIDFVMEFTMLDKLADKPITGLSKGMKQRLCLGRTMIHDPAVLIMDEPAAGLDPRARIELREMISRLAELNKTVLISSHILTELEDYCTDLLILSRGKLVEQRALGPSAGGRTLIAIELAQPWPDALSLLQDMEVVSTAPTRLQVRIASDVAAHAALLHRLVAAGVPVSRFGPDQEDIQALYKARVKS